MKKIVYVLMHILNEDHTEMVGLLKKKGPASLINKLTVPGGKSENQETIFEAATREAKEECGLDVHHWQLFDTVSTPEYDYHKLYSIGNDISKAKQMEIEPIFIMNIKEHLEKCKNNPQLYTHDFMENLDKLFADLNSKTINKKPKI